MTGRRYVFVESLTGDEGRMFATYVAGMDPRVFAEAAALIERDRAAFGRSRVEDAPMPVLVPRGVTPLYDWAAEGDFPSDTADTATGQELDEQPAGEVPAEAYPDGGDTPGYVPEALPEDLAKQAASRFLSDLVTGGVPGVRRIKTELGVGQDKAQQVRAYLAALANA